MPHLAEAHRHARLRAVLEGGRAQPDRWAVSDLRGYLREASAGFIHGLRERWPQWQGSRLPTELLGCVREARPYVDAGMRLRIAEKGEFRYLESIAPSALDKLAPRERQIAERYARGETYGAIAAALALSPATVRNHITRCYRKLAVNNKAELVLRIAQNGIDGNTS